MQQAAGTQATLPGSTHAAQAQPKDIIVQASCLARRGIARRARHCRIIGPNFGCSSSQRSQRELLRAKQKAASSTNGVVGNKGRKMPTAPVTKLASPAPSQSRRRHKGRVLASASCTANTRASTDAAEAPAFGAGGGAAGESIP